MKDGKVFVTDYNIHIVLRKMRLDLRKAYQLQEIIAIISKEISENGFTDEDYCLYSHEDMLTPEVVCYLGKHIQQYQVMTKMCILTLLLWGL